MKRIWLVAALAGTINQAAAQAAPPIAYDTAARYPVPQLRADLAYVRRALEEAHPALYWYTPQDSLDQAFAQAEAALTHPMAEPEYWRLLQALVVRVRCGHTRVQHSAAYRAWFRRQPHAYLPFLVTVRHDRLFITQNLSTEPALRPGTELMAIDGHPTAEVLPRLRSLLAGDGYGTRFADHTLEVGFFDEYYWNFYPARPVYPLLVADSTGRQQLLTPQPRPAAAKKPAPPAPTSTAAEELARRLAKRCAVRYPAELPGTAVLRIAEFNYDELEDYRKFHAELFAELKRRRIRRLVLDLRGNGGGNLEIAADLLKYLLKKDFYLTRSALAPVGLPSFMQAADSTGPAYFAAREVRQLPGGQWAKVSSSNGLQHPYRGHYFRGQVVVLVDEGSFSATSNLAASLRAQRRVVVLGQETGGGEAGCSGGTISELELPATHLVLSLPHFRMLSDCRHPLPGRGVRPDVEVVPTPRQLATYQDALLPQLPALLRRSRPHRQP